MTAKNLTTLGSKTRGSEFADWKSTLISVVPAEAGIQAGFELELENEPGCRRSPA